MTKPAKDDAMHARAMNTVTNQDWKLCYRLYEQIYQESYPYRELPDLAVFLQNPGPFTTMTSPDVGFVLIDGDRWIGTCHYRMNLETVVLTSEVKFLQDDFHLISAEAMVQALAQTARAKKAKILQMVVENALICDYYTNTGAFQKVGLVKESVLDILQLDATQQKQWIHSNFQLKPIDWDDDGVADPAVPLHNQCMADVPRQGAVGAQIAHDRRYFQELRDNLLKSDRLLHTFGLYDKEKLIGLSLVDGRRDKPQTFVIHFTAIDRTYRGHGVGKTLKALTVARLQHDFPTFRYMITGNEETNTPMLKINNAMGFRVRAEYTMLRFTGDL